MRSGLFLSVIMLASSFVLGQSPSRDTQALESLVKELRQLRQDLVTTTVAAQRVQIVLYRLQGQETAVQRAAQRRDLARDRLTDTESQIKRVSEEIQRSENRVTQSDSAVERKEMQEQVLPRLKADLETLRHLQQQQQPNEADAEEQLRAEEAKLSELETFLDKLDKSLSEFGPR
jgi:DNA repair exonuclease SbcCD ATPase subunit